MKNYNIIISEDKALTLLEDKTKKGELIHNESWLSSKAIIKLTEGKVYTLTTPNLLYTNTNLVDEKDNVLYSVALLWNGKTVITDNKGLKLTIQQEIFPLKNEFAVYFDKKEIIKMTVEVKLNKIASFNFEIINFEHENLEMLLLLIANSSLFYLNLKKISL